MSVDNKTPNDQVKIEIMLATDEGYCRLLMTVMASILANAKSNESLRFHILDGGLSEKSRRMISELRSIRPFDLCFYTPDVKLYEKLFPNFSSYGLVYRLTASQLLPETIDRVIYLDCDVLVLSSLQELWNTPLYEKFCAAAYDVHCSKTVRQELNLPSGYRYFNSGVLLINLKEWREKGLADKFGQIATENMSKLRLIDQDVLNIYAASNGYLELDGRWNFYAGDPVDYDALGILHYWGKFWFWNSHGSVQSSLLAKYVALTPFKKFPWQTRRARLYRYWIYFLSMFVFPRSQSKAFRSKRILKMMKW